MSDLQMTLAYIKTIEPQSEVHIRWRWSWDTFSLISVVTVKRSGDSTEYRYRSRDDYDKERTLVGNVKKSLEEEYGKRSGGYDGPGNERV